MLTIVVCIIFYFDCLFQDMAHHAIIQAENNSIDALASNNHAANNSDQVRIQFCLLVRKLGENIVSFS